MSTLSNTSKETESTVFQKRGTRALGMSHLSKETEMAKLWRFVPWLNRLILLAPLVIMTLIGVRIITDPVHSASEHGMSLDSPVGLTNYRSGNGGIFVAFAIFTFTCLLVERRHLIGLSFVALLMGIILGLRGISALADATVRQQMPLLIVEAVFLALSVLGLVLELARRRRLENAVV